MKGNSCMLFVLMALFMAGCKSGGPMTAQEYLKYMGSNMDKISKQKKCGDVNMKVSVYPVAYYVLKSNGTGMTRTQYDSVYSSFDGLYYAELSVSGVNGSDPLDVGISDKQQRRERIYYYSFDVQHDIELQCDTSSMGPPVLYHYEQSYGLRKEMISVIAFNKDASCSSNDLVFILNDKVYGNGIVKFSFDKEFINHSPDLKI